MCIRDRPGRNPITKKAIVMIKELTQEMRSATKELPPPSSHQREREIERGRERERERERD